METNNIINIPEGFEIDKEQSNERMIVLKKIESKRVRSWKEYCEKMRDKDSYYFNEVVNEIKPSKFSVKPILLEFEDKEEIEALVAFCKLRKLRKQWIGEWKPDYNNYNEVKFTIITAENEIGKGERYTVSCSMSFPTEEMRDEFFDTFKDLLEQAKSLL